MARSLVWHRRHSLHRLTVAFPTVIAVLAVVSFAVGCTMRTGAASDSGASPSVSSSPGVGVDRDTAIAIATSHVPADALLVRANEGPFSALTDPRHFGPGYPVAPDRRVWAVVYESNSRSARLMAVRVGLRDKDRRRSSWISSPASFFPLRRSPRPCRFLTASNPGRCGTRGDVGCASVGGATTAGGGPAPRDPRGGSSPRA